MSLESLIVAPTAQPGHVVLPDGRVSAVPEGWILVPPGDPALTRRLKKSGPTWTTIEMVGRKRFSQGVWAPEAAVRQIERTLVAERAEPSYQQKLERAREKRHLEQEVYEGVFRNAVVRYLAFHSNHSQVARTLARLVTEHTIPVGGGTVARTKTMPIEMRAEAATIAWMRHHTTEYDTMSISSKKGTRGSVRGEMAERSKALIARYRAGNQINPATCPLQIALRRESALSDPFK